MNMFVTQPVRRLNVMAIAMAFVLGVSLTSYGQDQAPNDEVPDQVINDLDVMLSQYSEIEHEYLDLLQKMSEANPQVQEINDMLNERANQIREIRQKYNLISPQQIHTKVQAFVDQLADIVAQLEPLVKEEQDLNDAVEHLRRASAELNTKRAMRNIFSEESIQRAQEDPEMMREMESVLHSMLTAEQERSAQKKLEAGDLQAAHEALRMDQAHYEAIIKEREVAHAQMLEQLEQVKRQADVELAQKYLAIAALQDEQKQADLQKAVAEATKNAHASMEQQNSQIPERLDRLEAEMAEVKDLLKQISSQLGN